MRGCGGVWRYRGLMGLFSHGKPMIWQQQAPITISLMLTSGCRLHGKLNADLYVPSQSRSQPSGNAGA